MDPRVERTRSVVLEAAGRLLVTEGVDAVTHQRVAEVAGVGRRTMYRHWPNPMALLRDTLARTEVPRPAPTGDLRRDLVAHLDALRDALDRGHLGYVVSLLGERSRLDPEFERLRAELTDLGCEPLERLLRTAIREGRLPADVDLPAALAELEGPVFYRCMIHRERLRSADVVGLADRFLTSPPLRKRRAQPFPPP